MFITSSHAWKLWRPWCRICDKSSFTTKSDILLLLVLRFILTDWSWLVQWLLLLPLNKHEVVASWRLLWSSSLCNRRGMKGIVVKMSLGRCCCAQVVIEDATCATIFTDLKLEVTWLLQLLLLSCLWLLLSRCQGFFPLGKSISSLKVARVDAIRLLSWHRWFADCSAIALVVLWLCSLSLLGSRFGRCLVLRLCRLQGLNLQTGSAYLVLMLWCYIVLDHSSCDVTALSEESSCSRSGRGSQSGICTLLSRDMNW